MAINLLCRLVPQSLVEGYLQMSSPDQYNYSDSSAPFPKNKHQLLKQLNHRDIQHVILNRLVKSHALYSADLVRVDQHHEGIPFTRHVLFSFQELSNQFRCIWDQGIVVSVQISYMITYM